MKKINYFKIIGLTILYLLNFEYGFAQTTVGTNNTPGYGYTGWDNSMGIALDVKTTNPFNIDFYTGNSLRMNLMGNALYNNGFLGIGRPFPRFRLEVSNNIGLLPNNWDEGYYIDSVPVVRCWPLDPIGIDYSNIFVGPRAGLNVNNVGTELTFVGANAGLANTSGDQNTFVGNNAGISNTSGNSNVFVGNEAGNVNTTGDFNSFIGMLSGQSNISGSRNIAIGDRAYSSGDTEVDNIAIGFDSGISLATGDSNVFMGSRSAFNQTTGSNNVSLGANAGSTFTTGNRLTLIGANTIADNSLTNASSIGNGVWVRNSNNLILGDNSTFVGIGLSGVASGPQVPLEINTSGSSSGTGNSGVRLRDLTSSSSSALTGVTKFLTVNGTGDVVLGDIPGGGGPISACSSPGLGTAAIGYMTRVSAANELCRSQVYDNLTTVGIGMGTSVNASFRLHIKGDVLIQPTSSNTGDIYMQDGSSVNRRVVAMYGAAGFSTLALGPGAGGLSTAANRSTYVGYNAGTLTTDELRNTFIGGSSGEAWSGSSTQGYNTLVGASAGSIMTGGNRNTFLGEKAGNTFATGDSNTFVGSEAGNGGITGDGNNNILVGNLATVPAVHGYENIVIGNRAHAIQTGGTARNRVTIGFTGTVDCDNSVTIATQYGSGVAEQRVGIGFTCPAVVSIPGGALAKLYVDRFDTASAAYFNGDVYSQGLFWSASDIMFKTNIQPVTNVSSIFDQLEVKTYDFKIQDFPQVGLPTGNHYGFIAQDVEQVLPIAVSSVVNPARTDSLGNITTPAFLSKAVNYNEFIPILFAEVKELRSQITQLEQQIANCCSNPQPLIHNNENPDVVKSTIALSNNETIILNQNAPNPFKDKTEISYSIPTSVKDAQILFYDQNGKVLHKFEISHRGQGSLTVYGEDLSSGIYTYSLIIDGKNHQTKRMMKQ